MTNAELISKLVEILEEARKPCEDCQEFDCDNCTYKPFLIAREGGAE